MAKVYYSKEISSEALVRLYKALKADFVHIGKILNGKALDYELAHPIPCNLNHVRFALV